MYASTTHRPLLPALPRNWLWAALAAAVLTACGGGDSTGTPDVTSPPTTEPTTPPVDGAEGEDGGGDDGTTPPPVATGRWTRGDLHVHTYQSDDAQTGLEQVLDQGFDQYGLDWMALSNHLRLSARDHTGAALPGGSIPFSRAMAEYEAPFIRQAQAAGRYKDKLILSSAEWDMPTHDHVNVGILTDQPMSDKAFKAMNQFEYFFTNRNAALFDAADVAAWNTQRARAYSTHADAVGAIAWLRDNHGETSYMLLNHPSRYNGRYTAAQLREMNDTAPNVFFMIEGLVGNQMEPDRGGYAESYTAANLPSRTYGGTDYMVARLGGMWDALLGEGRRVWTVANSDFHFKTAQGLYSSGYAPGEYAKTYLHQADEGAQGWLDSLRAGQAFGVLGDLIDALDFSAAGPAPENASAAMGGELSVKPGETVTVTIRFKSPERNNRETALGSGVLAGEQPQVDHVDLIAGHVVAKAAPASAAYAESTNASTRVIARFFKKDWQVDAEGYNVVTYRYTPAASQYLRLRGTNLGVDVAGETSRGEPLPDTKITLADNQARFDAIDARNYGDLWFYSNPVFVTVAEAATAGTR
ncbi:S-layer protein [Comamonadaceae bacterium PP-2]